MSIPSIFMLLSLYSLGYLLWLLTSKRGKEKKKTMPKKRTRFIFVGAGILFVVTLSLVLYGNLLSNPNMIGRRANKPADINQVVEVEGYEIEVTAANFAKSTHYLQGDSSTRYGTVSTHVIVRCQTPEGNCPEGQIKLKLPEFGEVDDKNISLNSGETEEIILTGHILSNSDAAEYSPALIEFHIQTPIHFYSAYFQVEVE